MAATLDIDRIVREVITRLREVEQTGGARNGSARTDDTSHASTGTLVLSECVVSMATLVKRLDAIKRVTVPERTVVTPAVRDELRQRKIELVFESNKKTEIAQTTNLIISVVGKPQNSAGIQNNYNDSSFSANSETTTFAADELVAATAFTTNKITREHISGIILTNQPIVAICLANRTPAIRAAAVNNAAAVTEAAKQIGANLLVVDSSRISRHEVRRIADALTRGGASECPTDFRQQLT